jgi:hypothetical protein
VKHGGHHLTRGDRWTDVIDSDMSSREMELEHVILEYHEGAGDFAGGNPEPIKALWSHRDDVTLANPCGPAVRGWPSVSDRLAYASSRMSDGELSDFQTLAMYVSDDLASSYPARPSGRRLEDELERPISQSAGTTADQP